MSNTDKFVLQSGGKITRKSVNNGLLIFDGNRGFDGLNMSKAGDGLITFDANGNPTIKDFNTVNKVKLNNFESRAGVAVTRNDNTLALPFAKTGDYWSTLELPYGKTESGYYTLKTKSVDTEPVPFAAELTGTVVMKDICGAPEHRSAHKGFAVIDVGDDGAYSMNEVAIPNANGTYVLSYNGSSMTFVSTQAAGTNYLNDIDLYRISDNTNFTLLGDGTLNLTDGVDLTMNNISGSGISGIVTGKQYEVTLQLNIHVNNIDELESESYLELKGTGVSKPAYQYITNTVNNSIMVNMSVVCSAPVDNGMSLQLVYHNNGLIKNGLVIRSNKSIPCGKLIIRSA